MSLPPNLIYWIGTQLNEKQLKIISFILKCYERFSTLPIQQSTGILFNTSYTTKDMTGIEVLQVLRVCVLHPWFLSVLNFSMVFVFLMDHFATLFFCCSPNNGIFWCMVLLDFSE